LPPQHTSGESWTLVIAAHAFLAAATAASAKSPDGLIAITVNELRRLFHALHRLLFGDPAPGTTPRATYPVPDDAAALTHLQQCNSPYVAVEQICPAGPARWTPPAAPTPEMAAATFERHLDTAWRRTSYSRLTATAHDAPGVSSEPEHPQHDDEAMRTVAAIAEAPQAAEMPSPMSDLPSGAGFGTLVHTVLETTDPAAADLLTELTVRCA
jgi:exodeoxyribonuclease V beta subunit